MANTIILSGNIGGAPEQGTTKNGANKTKFSLCYKNEGKESDKNNKNWINCIAYKGTADIVSKFLGSGDKVLLKGELNNVAYTNTEGKKINYHEMVVHYIEFINLKSKQTQTNTSTYDSPPVFSSPVYDPDSGSGSSIF